MVDFTVRKIKKDIYILRLNDSLTKYFEALWEIPEGITYNSYVVFTDENTIIIDGWKKGYEHLYIEALREIVEPKNITHIIVNHSEPDHSGTLPILLEVAKQSFILAHKIAIDLLQSFYRLEGRYKPITHEEYVKLSNNESIVIKHVPWLHWPDTIVSYFVEKKTLFTCDVFGSFGIPRKIFYEELGDDEKKIFNYYAKKYFVNIIGKYTDWVMKNLTKISQLINDAEIIAPGHGPIYSNKEITLSLYENLGSKRIEKDKIVIIYASMYGFTEEIVSLLIEELKAKGKLPLVYKLTDKSHFMFSEVIAQLYDAETIVIGTPNYDSDIFPLIKYIVELIKAKIPPDNKKIIILSSYGWGPVAAKRIRDILSEKGFKITSIVEFKGRAAENARDIVKQIIEDIS